MDRGWLSEHLLRAERHIEEGRARVEKQRLLVERLSRGGHGAMAITAAEILAGFEKLLAAHIADRDKILEELARNSN
jgi:hypothetical protein